LIQSTWVVFIVSKNHQKLDKISTEILFKKLPNKILIFLTKFVHFAQILLFLIYAAKK